MLDGGEDFVEQDDLRSLILIFAVCEPGYSYWEVDMTLEGGRLSPRSFLLQDL